MLVNQKSQIVYDKNLYIVSVSKRDCKLTACNTTGKVIAIHDNKVVVQLAGIGRFKELFYSDYNIAVDDLQRVPYNIHRVFNTQEEAVVYTRRIGNMELTPFETRIIGLDSNSKLKYAVFFRNEIRQMPIEIENHKVYSNNTRETKEFDGKTWYHDLTETRHSFKMTASGNECDVSDSGVKIFFDPHAAIDFYLGK